MKRRITLLVSGAVLLLLAGIVTWLLATQSGLRFAVARAEGMLAPRLRVESIEGAVARQIRVRGLHWQDADSGVDATLDEGEVDLGVGALLTGTLHVRRVDLKGLRVQLTPGVPKPPEPCSTRPER